ncbi:hypothetical protein Q604_UNBc4C00229G0001, partial [human gut metagenome]
FSYTRSDVILISDHRQNWLHDHISDRQKGIILQTVIMVFWFILHLSTSGYKDIRYGNRWNASQTQLS